VDIKGIIFDLDGVLCSTDSCHYLAWKELADFLDIPFDETVNQRLRGVSRMESLKIILEAADRNFSDQEKIELAERKNERYRNLLLKLTPADVGDDIRETLGELRKKGVLLAVGSSSKNTPLILNQVGLENWFDAVADGNDITRSKPDPEVFLLAAEKLGLPPSECMVVEDADAGIEAAFKGGFIPVGIGPAQNNINAVYHLTRFEQLKEIVF
jgi:beta-phosphoglucomutase